jgi:hypothetical protein
LSTKIFKAKLFRDLTSGMTVGSEFSTTSTAHPFFSDALRLWELNKNSTINSVAKFSIQMIK